jgi:integrase
MISDVIVGGSSAEKLPTPLGRGETIGAIDPADLAGAFAHNTRRAYAADWKDWSAYCAARDLSPLPAAPEQLREYILALADDHKVSTIKRRLAAIAQMHRLAGLSFDRKAAPIYYALRRLAREKGTAAAGRAELLMSDIEKMLDVMPRGLRGLRNRAMLLVGFAGALRPSELVGLRVEHVAWKRDGVTITIPKSKGDQDGAGQEVGIKYGKRDHTCPVRALKRWLEAARLAGGPVFRLIVGHNIAPHALTPQAVWSLVKRYAQRAGLDAEPLGGHSLRVGCLTQALANGADPLAAQRHLRHKDLRTTLGYDRNKALGADNISGKLGT